MSAGDTIDSLLREQARARPEEVALLDPRAGEVLTFAGLERAVAGAAAAWRHHGIARGHSVLVFVPMSARLYVALLGLFRIGAVAVFLDPASGREHLERCCARCPPDALLAVARAHLLRCISPALRRIPRHLAFSRWVPCTQTWRPEPQSDSEPAAAGPADPALITFTSGSTGQPKAAVRTQAFLLAQYRVLAPNLHLAPGDIDLATLPVFVLANLAAGATTVLPEFDVRRPGDVDAAKVWQQIVRDRVTRITASPAFFERLCAHAAATGGTLPGLRHLATGGAPVFPRLLEAMQRLAPQAKVEAIYGSTEAEPIAHLDAAALSPDDRAAMRQGRGLLAGQPVAEVRVRVLRDRWGQPRAPLDAAGLEAETVATGDPGEITVAGPHVLTGYLGGVGDEETKFHVGPEVWHRTGDAGCIDAAGRLWLLGRCAARIDDALGQLYPLGVESAALTCDGVRRAAFVAHAGQRWLVVEAEPSAALDRALRTAVAWAQVDTIRCVARLPVDARHNAKVDYPALRRLLGE
jgi:acyl-CoA synthetase (AMP-forming)/AMP-acid ligase II